MRSHMQRVMFAVIPGGLERSDSLVSAPSAFALAGSHVSGTQSEREVTDVGQRQRDSQGQ
jgi:hypothetical protein